MRATTDYSAAQRGLGPLAGRAARVIAALAAAAVALLPAQPAAAESLSDLFEAKPFYIEADLGAAVQIPEQGDSRRTVAGGLALGYQFHRHFALELSHTRYNLASQETEGETYNTNLLALSAKLTFPFGPGGSRFFFELGPASYQFAYDTIGSASVLTALGTARLNGAITLEKSGFAPHVALGMDWIRSSGLYMGFELGYTVLNLRNADAGVELQGSGQRISVSVYESLSHEALGIFFAIGYRF